MGTITYYVWANVPVIVTLLSLFLLLNGLLWKEWELSTHPLVYPGWKPTFLVQSTTVESQIHHWIEILWGTNCFWSVRDKNTHPKLGSGNKFALQKCRGSSREGIKAISNDLHSSSFNLLMISIPLIMANYYYYYLKCLSFLFKTQ